MVDKAIDCSGRAAQSYKRVPDSKDEGGSSYEISASNLQENLSFGSSTVTKEDSDERIFWWLTRVFIAFFLRILSLVYALGFKEGRLNNTHPSDSQNSAAEHSLTRRNIEDHLSPCFERLQKLEVKFDELTNKPAEIPFEKEQVLHESWDRIKHIEFELERTKRSLETKPAGDRRENEEKQQFITALVPETSSLRSFFGLQSLGQIGLGGLQYSSLALHQEADRDVEEGYLTT